jgi:hypothetical protein
LAQEAAQRRGDEYPQDTEKARAVRYGFVPAFVGGSSVRTLNEPRAVVFLQVNL